MVVPARRFKIEHYADEQGRRVFVHVFLDPGVPRRYIGQMPVRLGERKGNHNFVIEVKSVAEAFDRYEEVAAVQKAKLRKAVGQGGGP